MTQRPEVDWEGVEREYRAGQMSVANIAREYSISRPAIDKRAKKYGWARNLASAVRNEIESRLVADGVAGCNTREAIDVAASRGVEVVRSHRQGIAKLETLRARLTEKAETLIEKVEDIKSLGDAASAVESLGRTQVKLIQVERQAFNLGNSNGDDKSELSWEDAVIRAAQAAMKSVTE